MEARQPVVREQSNKQFCPPNSQNGKPSHGPRNTFPKKPRRSNSTDVRPSSHSGAQAHQEVNGGRSKLSPRSLVAALKKGITPAHDNKDKGALTILNSSSQASTVKFHPYRSRGHGPVNYQASLPTLTSTQEPSSIPHSKSERAEDEHPSCHGQYTESNSSAEETIQEVNETTVYSPDVSHISNLTSTTVMDQPPIPPPHSSMNNHIKSSDFNRVLDDQCEIIDELKLARDSLAVQLEDEHTKHQAELQVLHHDIAKWKARAADAAGKSASVQSQTPLSRPESELIKDWQNLDFNVRNFVSNHFGNVSANKISSWAKAKGDLVREVAQSCHKVVTSKRSGVALIEATIWNVLVNLVFGGVTTDGSMCWADGGKGNLRNLVQKIEKDQGKLEEEQFSLLFHQWGALTANIMSAAQTIEQREQEVKYVAEEVEDLLTPCRSRMSSSLSYRRELQALINQAIDVDLRFSGQSAKYLIAWPGQTRSNVNFDHALMKTAAGCVSSSRVVAFTIQPCLFRAGGRGESYRSLTVIHPCSVWMAQPLP